MNTIIRDQFPILREYQALRPMALELLADTDLAFSPGGAAPSLAALCIRIGEVEHSYAASIASRTIDFAYRNDDPARAGSVAALRDWYSELDRQLHDAVAALSDEDVAAWQITRFEGFTLPLQILLDVYKEALLLFYGRVDVYLTALGKTRPERWAEWLG